MPAANNTPTPDWDQILSAVARWQREFPATVRVGRTVAAIHAHHRMSCDADHVLANLRTRFEDVLGQLESIAGWTTARVRRPVLIPGSLDGIETGVRQLVRNQPLETETVMHSGCAITVPTAAEIMRIKAVLILRRNALRDYIDFAALGSRMTVRESADAMRSFDALYPQTNGESALQQLLVQLAAPRPYDLDESNIQRYRDLSADLRDWTQISKCCQDIAQGLFDQLVPDTAKRRENPSRPNTLPTLSQAIKSGDSDRVRQLIADGADVNALSDKRWTPLHIAAHRAAPDLVQTLLATTADPNSPGPDQSTPLHWAVQRKAPEVASTLVMMLLAAGIDPALRDGQGRTALMIGMTNPALTGTEGLTRLRDVSPKPPAHPRSKSRPKTEDDDDLLDWQKSPNPLGRR